MHHITLTTGQRANLFYRDKIKRGNPYPETETPQKLEQCPTFGGQFKRAGFFTRRAALAVLAVMAAACPHMTPIAFAQSASVLKIGSIFALSGTNASIGKEQLIGAQYAVKTINAAGGVEIGGTQYTLELINIDDESKAERSIAGAEKLIGEDDVKILLTPPSSTTTLGVIPIAEKHRRVALSFVAAAPTVVSPEFQYSFRTTLSAIMHVAPSIEYMIRDRGVKKIAYMGRNDDWGRATGAAIQEKANTLGAEVVVEEYFDAGSTDFYGLLTKIRAARSDVVVGGAFMEEGIPMIKQYRELQMSQPFLSVGVIWASPTFLKAAGASVDGVYIATGPTTSTSPALDAFKAQFLKDTGTQALPFSITAFDNVNLVVAAMRQAGSTDPAKLADTLRHFEYEGLLQTYKFSGSNQSQVVINVNEVKHGAISVISSLVTN